MDPSVSVKSADRFISRRSGETIADWSAGYVVHVVSLDILLRYRKRKRQIKTAPLTIERFSPQSRSWKGVELVVFDQQSIHHGP